MFAKVAQAATDVLITLAIPGGSGLTGAKFMAASAGSGALLFAARSTKGGTFAERAANAAVGAVAGVAVGGATVVVGQAVRKLTYAFASKYGGANVATHSLKPSDLTPTHAPTYGRNKLEKFVNKIRTEGIQETIKVVESDGVIYVVDGHHRLYAARALKLDSVPIEKVELPYLGYKTVMDLKFTD